MKFIIPNEFKRTNIAKFVEKKDHKITIDQCLDFLYKEVCNREK